MVSTPTEERAEAMAQREPKAKGIRAPVYLSRSPATFWHPLTLNSEQWRTVVAHAPVVRSCIATMVMQVTGLNWYIESEDEKAAEYYELVLNTADDGAGFENMLARVIEDALTVPFGGAWEIGSYPDETVAWLAHLDAGLMKPTYDYKLPYAQVDPWLGPLNIVTFERSEVSRLIWLPQPSVRQYGWTRTPCMDCLAAIQGLLRSDRFWQSMLTDSPPPGILDVLGMTTEEAKEWLDSWKTMMAGVDALKVPILTGEGRDKETGPAHFISFGKSPTETELPDLVKRYAELVCAAFGMNVADLGLFGQELRLAGATKIIELSKRQGLAHVLKRTKQRIDNDVLPDGCEFNWEDVELEDTVRRQAAKKQAADRLAILTNAYIVPPEVALAQAIEEELITVEIPEGWSPGRPPGAPPTEGEPTGQKGVGTKGKELGEEGRSRPKGAALRQQGDDPAPPRAFPTASKPAQDMGKIVAPWIAGIARSVTKARIARLLDVGINTAGDMGLAGATGKRRALLRSARRRRKRRAVEPSPAEQAIERLLASEYWWRAPDISTRVSAALAKAYEEGLIESAGDVQKQLYRDGLVGSPHLGVTTAVLKDPRVLEALRQRAYGLITNVDAGTDHYIRQQIMAGVRKGISSPEISRSILVDDVRRGVIEKFRGRSLSIVNTEINWAESKAALEQQDMIGLTSKVWRAVSGVACDTCLANQDRGVVPADHHWDSVWGPGTIDHPPAHPNVCHCWVTFDVDELKATVADTGEPAYWTGEAR